ncbi:unnamed protein product [Tenebrio molitor]|nr:unnamed protein product [Tenebrio molitor]
MSNIQRGIKAKKIPLSTSVQNLINSFHIWARNINYKDQ